MAFSKKYLKEYKRKIHVHPVKVLDYKDINEKYRRRATPGSIVFKVIGITLICAGFCFIDKHLNQHTSFNFITSGLGFLIFVIGCTIDGQIRLGIRGWTVVRTRKDHPKEFKRITGILDLIGFGLIIYGLLSSH